jgi:hypothetical protein
VGVVDVGALPLPQLTE